MSREGQILYKRELEFKDKVKKLAYAGLFNDRHMRLFLDEIRKIKAKRERFYELKNDMTL